MQTYINTRIQTDSSFSDHNLKMKIDLFVRDQLYTHNQNDEALCSNISESLHAIFSATTGQARGIAKKRDQKCASKLSEISTRTELASLVMYQINQWTLKEFLKETANVWLIQNFYKQDGLALSDPHEEKPTCRVNELLNLLHLKCEPY